MFVFVLLIVAVYMTIVHRFLVSAEEPEDVAKERREAINTRAPKDAAASSPLPGRSQPVPSMEF